MLNRRRFLALTTLASSSIVPTLSACSPQAKKADVIIIGAGHSGLAAAVSAAQQGAKVIVIEKRPFVGLNTHSDRGLFASSFRRKEFLHTETAGKTIFVSHTPPAPRWQISNFSIHLYKKLQKRCYG